MTYTYVLGEDTDINKVRLLIPDHSDDLGDIIFQDEELQALIDMSSDVLTATAYALEVIATREALVQKVARMSGVQTDGAKLSAEIRARAAQLRTLATDDSVDISELFDWAEIVYDQFTAEDRAYNELLRST